MTRNYCIESITKRLHKLGVPFAKHFARALIALLTARKITLHHIVNLMPGEEKAEAKRMQLRRCLDHPSLELAVWAKAIAALLPKGKWVLALDRTEWKRGKTVVNLLVLSVVVYGCAVPLLWTALPNCGNSDTAERIELMSQFMEIFGATRWRFLTADREFIGDDWISWLLKNNLDFRIRIKACEWLKHPDGRDQQGKDWFGSRACKCKPHRMQLWNQMVYVAGKYLYNNEYLIIISNTKGDLMKDYRLRWKIETLFQGLKKRGFDLESCRVSEGTRLSGWFGFLALGFCWCLIQGAALDESDPLKPKNHKRRAVSTFRRGLDWLSVLISFASGQPCSSRFDAAISLLDPVPQPSKALAKVLAL